jgi:hypothetical protein
VGRRYLVYAFEEKLLVTASCGRTMLAEYAGKEMEKLDRFWYRVGARLYPF